MRGSNLPIGTHEPADIFCRSPSPISDGAESPIHMVDLEQIRAITYDLKNDRLITGHKGGKIKIWQYSNGSLDEIFCMRPAFNAIIALAVTNDNKLISASRSEIRIGDYNGSCLQTIDNIGTIYHLTAPTDAAWFAAIIANHANRKCICIVNNGAPKIPPCQTLSENFTLLATNTELIYKAEHNNSLVVFNIKTSQSQFIRTSNRVDTKIVSFAICDYNCIVVATNISKTTITQGSSATYKSSELEFYSLDDFSKIRSITFNSFYIIGVYPCNLGVIVVNNKNNFAILDSKQKDYKWCPLPPSYCSNFGFIGLSGNKVAYIKKDGDQTQIVVLELAI